LKIQTAQEIIGNTDKYLVNLAKEGDENFFGRKIKAKTI
jgi:hypothetical protein